MRPAIEDGDTVTVAPVSADDVRPLDIICCLSRNGRVLVHRVTRILAGSDQRFFLVQGDNQVKGAEKISAGDVLGKVCAIRRNPKLLPARLRNFLSLALKRMQGTKNYGFLIKKIFKPQIAFTCREADTGLFRFSAVWGKKAAAIADLANDPAQLPVYQGWWLCDVWTHWAFRRIGLAEKLVAMACAEAAAKNAAVLRLLVFADNAAALQLYEKSGFKKAVIAEIEKDLKQEESLAGRRRILMMKQIA